MILKILFQDEKFLQKSTLPKINPTNPIIPIKLLIFRMITIEEAEIL